MVININMGDKNRTDIAGVILSGGRSSRMGQDKAGLILHDNSLLCHMQNLLKMADIEAVFVSDGMHIKDIIAHKGPLSGIHACLLALRGKYHYIIFVPVDMPALSSEIIQGLMPMDDKFDYTHYNQQVMPICIAVNDHIIAHIEGILQANNNLSIRNFLKPLNGKILPCNGDFKQGFVNLNTPEEWHNYENSN